MNDDYEIIREVCHQIVRRLPDAALQEAERLLAELITLHREHPMTTHQPCVTVQAPDGDGDDPCNQALALRTRSSDA